MTTNADVKADINADYQKAGFGQSLPPGQRPAVLVIDLCNAYLQSDAPLYVGSHADDVRSSAARLVAEARRLGHPVVFTRVEYEPGGADGGLFFKKVGALAYFVKGNPLGDFPHDPSPNPGEVVVTKQYASAFFATSLASTLNAMRVDTVVIAGVSTSGCVRASALDALQNGFVPLVVRDAVGDRQHGPHEANLFDLQAKYAEVVSEEIALRYLASTAD
jgi:maleamate amidohydrolase